MTVKGRLICQGYYVAVISIIELFNYAQRFDLIFIEEYAVQKMERSRFNWNYSIVRQKAKSKNTRNARKCAARSYIIHFASFAFHHRASVHCARVEAYLLRKYFLILPISHKFAQPTYGSGINHGRCANINFERAAPSFPPPFGRMCA